MKKITLLLSLLISICSFGQDLIITGVFDGPLTGGVPKAVELYVINDIPDLSLYGFGSANNGGGSDGQEFTFTGSASAGDFLYIATPASDDDDENSPTFGQTYFEIYFGFEPNFLSGAAVVNGDDAVELFLNEEVIDVYGNADGSGEDWDYLDGWAYRNSSASPSTIFNSNDWIISGTNVNDGETSNATATTPFPIMTFSQPVLNNQKFDLLKSTTALFPNPSTKGKVNFVSDLSEKVEMAIYNSLGVLVKELVVKNNEEISTENLATGIYFVQLGAESGSITKRLVIQ